MSENRCVCCGDIIPEGRQICPACEKGYKHGHWLSGKTILGTEVMCSNCGFTALMSRLSDQDKKFCPKCHSKMEY